VIPAGTTVQNHWAAWQLYTTLYITDSGTIDYNRSANVVMHPCHTTKDGTLNTSRSFVLLPTPQTRVTAEPVLSKPNQGHVPPARDVLVLAVLVIVLARELAVVLVQYKHKASRTSLAESSRTAGASQAAGSHPPVMKQFAANPLVAVLPSGVLVPTEFVDLCKERQLLCKLMSETRSALGLDFDYATIDRLRTAVTLGSLGGCIGWHFTGHGTRDGRLAFEDGRGAMHLVNPDELFELLQADGGIRLQFVFLAACHSELAAGAFVQAGVPHVVAVQRNMQITEAAVHGFMSAFYPALMVGLPVQVAFEIGAQAVFAAPRTRRESSYFLLLPHDTTHDSGVLPLLPLLPLYWALGKAEESFGALLGAQRQRLPVPILFLAGRNIEAYDIISDLMCMSSTFDRRMVSISGCAGVGKSCLAVFALNYLANRHHFLDGAMHVHLSDCDIGALMLALDGAIVVALGTPQHVDPMAPQWRQPPAQLLEMMTAVVAPLRKLNCLLVLDGVAIELLNHPAFLGLLSTLLSFANVRTLVTARRPVASSLLDDAETAIKFIELAPLSARDMAELLCRVSPRKLDATDAAGARNRAHLHQMLARRPLVQQYINGNPGRLVAIAPRLQTCSLYELERDLGLSPPPPPPPPPMFSQDELAHMSAMFAQPAAARRADTEPAAQRRA